MDGCYNTLIGGKNEGEGNVIAYNFWGILQQAATNTKVTRNSIYDNSYENVIGSLLPGLKQMSRSSGFVRGELKQVISPWLANTTYCLEAFACPFSDRYPYKAGNRFVGDAIVTTNEVGYAAFEVSFTDTVRADEVVCVNATPVGNDYPVYKGNTSYFSYAIGDPSITTPWYGTTRRSAYCAVEGWGDPGSHISVFVDGTPKASGIVVEPDGRWEQCIVIGPGDRVIQTKYDANGGVSRYVRTSCPTDYSLGDQQLWTAVKSGDMLFTQGGFFSALTGGMCSHAFMYAGADEDGSGTPICVEMMGSVHVRPVQDTDSFSNHSATAFRKESLPFEKRKDLATAARRYSDALYVEIPAHWWSLGNYPLKEALEGNYLPFWFWQWVMILPYTDYIEQAYQAYRAEKLADVLLETPQFVDTARAARLAAHSEMMKNLALLRSEYDTGQRMFCSTVVYRAYRDCGIILSEPNNTRIPAGIWGWQYGYEGFLQIAQPYIITPDTLARAQGVFHVYGIISLE